MKIFILKRRLNRFLGKALIATNLALLLSLGCSLAAVNGQHVQLQAKSERADAAIASAKQLASVSMLGSALPATALLPPPVAEHAIPARLPGVKPPVPQRKS